MKTCRKTPYSRYYSWAAHYPEIWERRAWYFFFMVRTPAISMLWGTIMGALAWAVLHASGRAINPLILILVSSGMYLPVSLVLNWRMLKARRRAVAAGELKYAAVTVGHDGVTVGLIPNPWSVSWCDLVVPPTSDDNGFELGGADGARSGRVHVSPFLSTRLLDGRLADDESMAALLSELRDLGAQQRERLIDPRRTQAPYWRYAVDWPRRPDKE